MFCRIKAEAVYATFEPDSCNVLRRLAYFRIIVVEIGHAAAKNSLILILLIRCWAGGKPSSLGARPFSFEVVPLPFSRVRILNGLLKPRMLAGGMVQRQVQYDFHTARVCRLNEM